MVRLGFSSVFVPMIGKVFKLNLSILLLFVFFYLPFTRESWGGLQLIKTQCNETISNNNATHDPKRILQYNTLQGGQQNQFFNFQRTGDKVGHLQQLIETDVALWGVLHYFGSSPRRLFHKSHTQTSAGLVELPEVTPPLILIPYRERGTLSDTWDPFFLNP